MRQTLIQRSRRTSAADKATYHQILGAGRAKVKRQFFGLSPTDEKLIRERLEQHLDRVVHGTTR